VSEYSEEVLEHVRNPRGPGRLAEGAGRVVSGEALAPDGGQRVRLHLELGADGGVARARFQAFGCPVTIAVASAAVERLEGASLARARALRADELAHALALAPEQRALAELPIRALAAALAYPAPRP
jgi:NifU-like protein involved in Fe-S cluster formation